MPSEVQIDASFGPIAKGQARLIFRNPRGNKRYYSFYRQAAPTVLKYEWSSNGTTWTNSPIDIYTPVPTCVIYAFDVKIRDDGNQLIVWLVIHALDNNITVTKYVRGTIADSSDTISWGSIQTIDGNITSNGMYLYHCIAIARTANGRLVLAFTEDITSKGKNYRQTKLIGSDGDGASPTWSGETLWDDPSGNTNNQDKYQIWFGLESFSSSYGNRILLYARLPDAVSTAAYSSQTAVPEWNGTAFSNTTKAAIGGAITVERPISGLVNASDYAHVIYGTGSTLQSVKSGSAGDDNWGSAIQVAALTVDATTLALDTGPATDELYAFYHDDTQTQDFYYKKSPVDTISWGTQQTITYAQDVTALTSWNRDVESSLHIGGVRATDVVWYHVLTLAAPPVTGSATLNAAGTLTAVGNVTAIHLGQAALSASGSVVAVGGRILTGQATVTASSSTDATGTYLHKGTATLGGVASATATGAIEKLASAALSASAMTDAIGRLTLIDNATLASTGTLTSQAYMTRGGQAALDSAATLSASGTVGATHLGQAALDAAGTLTAVGQHIIYGAAALDVAGTQTVSGEVTRAGSATLSGDAALAVSGGVVYVSSAALTGSATVSSVGQRIVGGAANISGDSTVSATAKLTIGGSANISGDSAVSAIAYRIAGGSASLPGSATSTIVGSYLHKAAATPSGAATLTATGQIEGLLTGAAVLNAAGTAGVAGAIEYHAVVSLTGSGATVVAGGLILNDTANLSATSSVSSSAGLILLGTISASSAATVTSSAGIILLGATQQPGAATLSASGAYLLKAASALSATGTIAAIAQHIVYGIGALAGAGTQTAEGKVTRAGAANIVGDSTVAAVAQRFAGGSAALSASGSQSVAAGIVYQANTALTGAASLSATAAIEGLLTGAAVLNSVATTAIAGAVEFHASSAFGGSSSLVSAGGLILVDSVTISGSATTTAIGKLTFFGNVAMAGAASQTSSGAYIQKGASALAGNAALTASGDIVGQHLGQCHAQTGSSLMCIGSYIHHGQADIVSDDPSGTLLCAIAMIIAAQKGAMRAIAQERRAVEKAKLPPATEAQFAAAISRQASLIHQQLDYDRKVLVEGQKSLQQQVQYEAGKINTEVDLALRNIQSRIQAIEDEKDGLKTSVGRLREEMTGNLKRGRATQKKKQRLKRVKGKAKR